MFLLIYFQLFSLWSHEVEARKTENGHNLSGSSLQFEAEAQEDQEEEVEVPEDNLSEENSRKDEVVY